MFSFCVFQYNSPVIRASHLCYEGGEGAVRLADGPSSREGRVDICLDYYWYTPCQDSWGLEETHVVCRELGFCQQGGELYFHTHWNTKGITVRA